MTGSSPTQSVPRFSPTIRAYSHRHPCGQDWAAVLWAVRFFQRHPWPDFITDVSQATGYGVPMNVMTTTTYPGHEPTTMQLALARTYGEA